MGIVLSWFAVSTAIMALGYVTSTEALSGFGAIMMLMTSAVAPC